MRTRWTVNEVMEKIKNENKKPFFSIVARARRTTAEVEIDKQGSKEIVADLAIAALVSTAFFLVEYCGIPLSKVVEGFIKATAETEAEAAGE